MDFTISLALISTYNTISRICEGNGDNTELAEASPVDWKTVRKWKAGERHGLNFELLRPSADRSLELLADQTERLLILQSAPRGLNNLFRRAVQLWHRLMTGPTQAD